MGQYEWTGSLNFWAWIMPNAYASENPATDMLENLPVPAGDSFLGWVYLFFLSAVAWVLLIMGLLLFKKH
jgi:hypothetical protein